VCQRLFTLYCGVFHTQKFLIKKNPKRLLQVCTFLGTYIVFGSFKSLYLDIAGDYGQNPKINPLNAELNPTRHLLALVGARHFVRVSRIRVKLFLNDHI
jgi:hypothetical protein